MSVVRNISGAIICYCCLFSPRANAALEVAAKKANTSIGLAHTAANAWALETDPAITTAGSQSNSGDDAPPLSDYFFLNGSLSNTYDPSVFTLDTDPNGLPSIANSVSGLDGFEVTSFTVDYFANPAGNTDPGGKTDSYAGGYPSITVTLSPTANDPLADTLTFNPDADGNEPDINLPVGEVTGINFVLESQVDSALSLGGGTSQQLDATQDQFFFQLNLTGPSNPPPLNNPLYTAFAGPNDFLNLFDPGLSPDDPNYETTTTDIGASELPEPAGLSLLAATTLFGLHRRRRQTD